MSLENKEVNLKKDYEIPSLEEENTNLEMLCTESSSLNDGGTVGVSTAGNIEVWK